MLTAILLVVALSPLWLGATLAEHKPGSWEDQDRGIKGR